MKVFRDLIFNGEAGLLIQLVDRIEAAFTDG